MGSSQGRPSTSVADPGRISADPDQGDIKERHQIPKPLPRGYSDILPLKNINPMFEMEISRFQIMNIKFRLSISKTIKEVVKKIIF